MQPKLFQVKMQYNVTKYKKNVFSDNHIDSLEMSYTTKLNDKQASAAVKEDKNKDGALNKSELDSNV